MSLQMKYFILKPEGNTVYSVASRRAMREYAEAIADHNPEMARELKSWAKGTALDAKEARKEVSSGC
jgi:hypothetical protein